MPKNFLKQVLDKQPSGPINTRKFIEKAESGYLVGRGTEFATKKSFSPSKLVWNEGACPRYWHMAFSGTEFKDNSSPYDVANMNSGIQAHERIQDAMQKSGLLIETEKKVIISDPPIFGFADGILQWEETQPVLEIKTMREESFSYRKHSKPPNYHIMQLIIYMKILGRKLGVLLYENKNSHELHIIPIEMDEEKLAWVEYAFDWMRKVRENWTNGLMPKKPYRANSRICKFCSIKDACFAAEVGTEKVEPLEYLE